MVLYVPPSNKAVSLPFGGMHGRSLVVLNARTYTYSVYKALLNVNACSRVAKVRGKQNECLLTGRKAGALEGEQGHKRYDLQAPRCTPGRPRPAVWANADGRDRKQRGSESPLTSVALFVHHSLDVVTWCWRRYIIDASYWSRIMAQFITYQSSLVHTRRRFRVVWKEKK